MVVKNPNTWSAIVSLIAGLVASVSLVPIVGILWSGVGVLAVILCSVIVLILLALGDREQRRREIREAYEVSRRGWSIATTVDNIVGEYLGKGVALQRDDLSEDERQKRFGELKKYTEARFQNECRQQVALLLRDLELHGVTDKTTTSLFSVGGAVCFEHIRKVSIALRALLDELDGNFTSASASGASFCRAAGRTAKP